MLLGRHALRARYTIPKLTLDHIRSRTFSLDVGLLEDLGHRGFIQDITRAEDLQKALNTGRRVVYAGIDPTANSLHVGHLIPMMCLLHFQIHGHKIIPLIGGATGLVGDPSGRFTERSPADPEKIEHNVVELTENITRFFQGALRYADRKLPLDKAIYSEANVASNLPWHKNFSLLEFLQKVGVYARVNTMLNRESVQSRLNSQQGISFTEFTYQLLQAYDFYHLHKNFQCSIQVGGSDQWGNILAGLEMINRIDHSLDHKPPGNPQPQAFGITTPLLTTASGEKFGKSAGNAVWLDPQKTTVVDFYQFFLKTADADVERYLKLFTLLKRNEIEQAIKDHTLGPEKRIAQRLLADEVTELVHGETGVVNARALSKLLFEADYSGLKSDHIIDSMKGDPRLVMVDTQELFSTPVIKLVAKFGLVASISQARTLVQSGGLYLNNKPLSDIHIKLHSSHLIDGRVAILRAGRDKFLILATHNSGGQNTMHRDA